MHFNELKLSGALEEFSITSRFLGSKKAKISFLKKISVLIAGFTADRFKAVVLLLLTFCFLLLPLWQSVIVLCFVVRYFMSIQVLQSS